MTPTTLVDDNARVIDAKADAFHDAVLASDHAEVALVAVMGTARVGKSWLASYLAGSEGLFESATGMRPTTLGASAVLTDMEGLNARFGLRPRDGDDTCGLVLADLEGRGDRGQEHDFRLLVPFMLLSRAVVYVAKQGGAGRNAFLDEMHVCVALATRVVGSLEGDDDTDAEADAEADVNADTPAPLFGTLHVVVNNVTGDLEAARKELGSWMQEERALRRDEQQRRAATRRNETRQALRMAFEDIVFHAVPPPSDDGAWFQKDSGSVEGLAPAYTRAIRSVVASLQPALHKPRHVGPMRVLPCHLVPLLRSISEAAFANQDIELLSLVDALVERTVQSVSDAALAEAEAEVRKSSDDVQLELERDAMPGLDMDGMRQRHKQLQARLIAAADEQLSLAAVPEARAVVTIAELSTALEALLERHCQDVESRFRVRRAEVEARDAREQSQRDAQRADAAEALRREAEARADRAAEAQAAAETAH